MISTEAFDHIIWMIDTENCSLKSIVDTMEDGEYLKSWDISQELAEEIHEAATTMHTIFALLPRRDVNE